MNINWKMVAIIAGVAVLAYLGWRRYRDMVTTAPAEVKEG